MQKQPEIDSKNRIQLLRSANIIFIIFMSARAALITKPGYTWEGKGHQEHKNRTKIKQSLSNSEKKTRRTQINKQSNNNIFDKDPNFPSKKSHKSKRVSTIIRFQSKKQP